MFVLKNIKTKGEKMPKKVVASKRPRGSSSFEYDRSRFVSIDPEVRFHNLVTRPLGLKERGFNIDVDNPRIEDFQRIIQSRCKHPKVATMTMVRKFFCERNGKHFKPYGVCEG